MKESKPAPAIVFIDAASNAHTLGDIGGKLIAVHFWASWCPPCTAELPQVDAASQTWGPQGLNIVALSLDSTIDKARSFMAGHHIDHLTPYLDRDNTAFQMVQSPGLPTTVFIQNGREIARAEGPLDWNEPAVKAFIDSHLK